MMAPFPTSRRPAEFAEPSEPTSRLLFPLAACHGTPTGAAPAPPCADRPAAPLVGIARLAHSSPRAQAKRETEYFLLPVRSILNHCDSERVPFAWTINPYRGCEFGCRYCYARYTHEYMELDAGEFDRKIFVKQAAGDLLERDLASAKVWGEHIAIGTATDPYQPAEREFQVTRALLERLAERRGLSLSITTKSNQIVRDLDLLSRIAERSNLEINITVTTLKPRLARLLEPRAPRPDLRLAALQRLREAGLAAGMFAMPVLPGLTDSEEDLEALAARAREADAQWFAANVLFLMPSAAKQFLPFIEQRFPRLARRYEQWYGRNGYAPESYRREITERVARLRAKYGLGPRPRSGASLAWQSPQLSLVLAAPPAKSAEGSLDPPAPSRVAREESSPARSCARG
jgi:DNA repair photolyase